MLLVQDEVADHGRGDESGVGEDVGEGVEVLAHLQARDGRLELRT